MAGEPTRSNTTAAVQSPNDILASVICDALVTSGVIKETHKESLLAKLKSGGVKQEDWNLWIDMATASQPNTGESSNE